MGYYSLVLLSCCAVLTASTDMCEDGETCTVDKSAPTESEYFYKISQQETGAAAVDVVVVASATQDTRNYHLWLQVAIPSLELQLKGMGIGHLDSTPNQYCVVQFTGTEGVESAKFLKVNGNTFFSVADFIHARRQIQRTEVTADGYYGIDFALKQAPFRTTSNITKMVFFMSNSERTALGSHSNITKATIKTLLKESGVIFTAVVAADMRIDSVDESGASRSAPVIALAAYDEGITVEDEFSFGTVVGRPTVSSSVSVIRDYVNLTLDLGNSVVGSLDPLILAEPTIVRSYVGAVVERSGLHALRRGDVCEQCLCGDEERVEAAGCEAEVCEVATSMNMDLCTCLVQSSPAECSYLINPSPVSVEIRSTSTLLGPRQTPMEGAVSVKPGGDVDVTFSSNKNRANYDCILLDNTTQTPAVESCTSPYQMKSVVEGQHTVLVIAKRKGFYGARRFDFEVAPSNALSSELELHVAELPEVVNGSVLVTMEARKQSGTPTGVRFMCSKGGQRFIPCVNPYQVPTGQIGKQGLLVVVVAIDSRNSLAVSSLHLAERVNHPHGPVSITILGVSRPDPLGRMEITFSTSRPDTNCICRTNVSNTACTGGVFAVDPFILGAGAHSISIVCMDSEGYSTTKQLKVMLSRPPPANPAPLSCNLSLVGPTPQGLVVAIFHCDRRVLATCQVSGRPAVDCNIPYGIHEIDVKQLSSGPHLFILKVQDGYGKSLMKLHHFTVGTAHRKCCPHINSDLSTLTMHTGQPSYALLDLQVQAGNCTESEGFSYDINWGDGSSEMGLSHRLLPVAVSKSYNSTTVLTGLAVEVSYCNNPILQDNLCCDRASFHNL